MPAPDIPQWEMMWLLPSVCGRYGPVFPNLALSVHNPPYRLFCPGVQCSHMSLISGPVQLRVTRTVYVVEE